MPMDSAWDDPEGPGFRIRISADQRLLATSHGFSQRATSFIASQCQGIHQMPLRRLISASVSRTGTNPDAQLGSRYQAYDPQRHPPATLPVRRRGRFTYSPCQTTHRDTLARSQRRTAKSALPRRPYRPYPELATREPNARQLGPPARASISRPVLVELNGIEPMTSCLQSRRSPN